jgi:hypothetical protein
MRCSVLERVAELLLLHGRQQRRCARTMRAPIFGCSQALGTIALPNVLHSAQAVPRPGRDRTRWNV